MDKNKLFIKGNEWFIRYKYEITLCAFITLLFLLLYWKYIFGGFAYVVNSNADVGNDQYYALYPSYYHLLNALHSGVFPSFDFSFGYGLSNATMISSLLNPFDGWLMLFPVEHLAYGLIFITYLKYIGIALFGFHYFKLLFNNNRTSFICATIWTFNSFAVIWGQQYSFLTIIALFTAFMYLLQNVVINHEKGYYKLIFCMAALCILSYYFFFIIGIFSVLYVIGYKALILHKPQEILHCLLILAGLALVAILLSSVCLLPTLNMFFESARVKGIQEQRHLFDIVNLKEMITLLSRLINPDLLGGAYGIPYSGMLNYYEAPMLLTNILFIPAMIYLLKEKKYYKNTVVISGLFLILLLFRFGNVMFTLTKDSYRWTFVILLLQVVAIGLFINQFSYLEKSARYKLFGCSLAFLCLVALILMAGDKSGLVDVHKKYLLLVITIDTVFMVSFFFSSNKLFYMLLIMNIFITYYPAISYRGVTRYGELNETGYEDGTQEVIKMLQKQDPGFYRINKTYDSVFYNDALVQNYMGVKIYTSVNTQGLLDFFNHFRISRLFDHPNYLSLNYDDIVLNGILSVKYYISNQPLENKQAVMTYNGYYVYKNDAYIPFGFLYSDEITGKESLREAVLIGYYHKETDLSDFSTDVIYELSESMRENINKLSEESLTNISFDEKKLVGTITNQSNKNQMLFLSIPYKEAAYKIFIDGELTKYSNINDAFVGVVIPSGKHQIKIMFLTPWLKEGEIISLISAVIIVISYIYVNQKKRLLEFIKTNSKRV